MHCGEHPVLGAKFNQLLLIFVLRMPGPGASKLRYSWAGINWSDTLDLNDSCGAQKFHPALSTQCNIVTF